MADDDARPGWAVELIKQVAILNEKVPSHIDWVERNIKDHETRLRDQKADIAAANSRLTSIEDAISGIPQRVDQIEHIQDQNSWLPRLFIGLGGGASGVIATVVIMALIQHA